MPASNWRLSAVRGGLVAALGLAVGGWQVMAAPPKTQTTLATAAPKLSVDAMLARENVARKVALTPVVDDLGFLRRVSVDLIGRIPTDAEITAYQKLPVSERRGKTIDRLLADPRFVDRWTVFFADMLRIRSNADGGQQFLAYVHNSLENDVPYDVMVRNLLKAHGKAGKTPEIGFILGDNADPMALAGVTSQVFLGVRIACAECHDHPFDVWKREQFYGLAAFFGKTRRQESELTNVVFTLEDQKTTILWPPAGEGEESERKPMEPRFPFTLDAGDGPHQHLARLAAVRAPKEVKADKPVEVSVDDLLNEASTKVAKVGKKPEEFDIAAVNQAERNKLNIQGDLQQTSALRSKLADLITEPRNRQFSRNLVNRAWAELLGRGFVEPLDDFSQNNPASHPQTLDYLADEFVASGYQFRQLVRQIVSSQAYQRTPLYGSDEGTRQTAEEAFAATPMRRMVSEALFDSIVLAGHLFDVKHQAGTNLKTDWRHDRVAVERAKATPLAGIQGKPQMASNAMPAMSGGGAMKNDGMKGPAKGYDVESAIEVDFAASLKEQPEVEVAAMQKMSNEELEALEMAQRASRKYFDRFVRITFDDNPKFGTSLRMASPANPEHFLRVFGQPSREALGEFRDGSSNMRQALMMLNGRITHEAARVGELEPMYALLVGKKADPKAAVALAYREILTREPTAEEQQEGQQLLKAAATPLDGMLDLRWLLLNCHEFRYLP